MSAAHTPGPWKAEGIAKVQNSSSLDYPITDERGACIAHVIFNEDGGDNREECHADARLIAAAPELLEALEGIASATCEKWEMPYADFKKQFMPWARNVSLRAIAKAKGETK